MLALCGITKKIAINRTRLSARSAARYELRVVDAVTNWTKGMINDVDSVSVMFDEASDININSCLNVLVNCFLSNGNVTTLSQHLRNYWWGTQPLCLTCCLGYYMIIKSL